MLSVDQFGLFEDLLDVLAEGADPIRLQSFRLPDAKQERLDELLEKNREGTLGDADRAELATYQQLEHVVRLLKARILQQRAS